MEGLFLLAELLGKTKINLISFKVGVVHGAKFLIRRRLVKSFLRILLLSFFSET